MPAAGAVMRLAADGDDGAILPRDIEIGADLCQMPLMDQRPDFGRGIEGVADLQRLHACGELLDEFFRDALLDQQPARGGAALAVERVDHEHDGIERAVEIGVVEHDHRVLAAELEMHALQGRRALRHDRGAGRAFADKADRLDRGMLGQRLAGFLADAVHGVEHAVGHAGLLHQLRQQVGGDRRPFRRLVHDRAAGGQRRGDLPGREHERRVPRRDHADRADRHPRRNIPVLLARHVQAVAGIGAFVGEEAEILGGADRGLGHEAMGLAGIDAFEHGDVVGTVLDRIGDPMQQLLAHRRRHVAPGLEGQRGRRRGAIDIFGIAARDGRQHRAIDRRLRLEGLARDRRHDLAVDHVADAVGAAVFNSGAARSRLAWNRSVVSARPYPWAASTFRASWMLLRFQLVSLSLICMSNDSANLLSAKTGSR